MVDVGTAPICQVKLSRTKNSLIIYHNIIRIFTLGKVKSQNAKV